MKLSYFPIIIACAIVSLTTPTSVHASITAPCSVRINRADGMYQLPIYWVNPNDSALAGINIYFSADPPISFGKRVVTDSAQLHPNEKGEYIIDQLVYNTIYWVKLTAVDTAGNESSPTVLTQGYPAQPHDLSAPVPVDNASVKSATSSSLGLYWINPVADDFYRVNIYRGTSQDAFNSATTPIGQIVGGSGLTQTFTNTSLSSDTTYFYRLVPEDVVGNLGDPIIISGKTLKAPIVPSPVVTPPVVEPTPATPPVVINPWTFDYRAQWVSQSGTLSADKTAHEIHGTAGSTVDLELTLKNIGKAWWYPTTPDAAHIIKLGTWMPQDNASPLKDASWLTSNRIVQIDSVTGTSLSHTFKFKITIPTTAVSGTVYKFYVRPVAEYVKWFGPTGIFWNVVVS